MLLSTYYVPPAVLYTPPIIKNQLGKLLQQIFPECVTKPYYIPARLLTFEATRIRRTLYIITNLKWSASSMYGIYLRIAWETLNAFLLLRLIFVVKRKDKETTYFVSIDSWCTTPALL